MVTLTPMHVAYVVMTKFICVKLMWSHKTTDLSALPPGHLSALGLGVGGGAREGDGGAGRPRHGGAGGARHTHTLLLGLALTHSLRDLITQLLT